MDAHQRLHSGLEAAMEGRYAEALRAYKWFHEHALKHEPSLYGVRLSFALWYWAELATKYPKAGDELEKIRIGKTKRLLKGEFDRELFHDVEAINGQLKRDRDTYELFAKLEAKNREFAALCASLALPAMVKSGDFLMARRYTPSPLESLRKHAKALNRDVAELTRQPPSKAPRLKAYVAIYTEAVRLLLRILRGTKERKIMEEVRAQAFELIESPAVRRAVRKALRAA
jgi:hypothetical protein